MAALRGLLKGQAQFVAHIVALSGCFVPVTSAAHAAVKELVENIAHTAHATEIHATERIATHATHIRPIKAKLVVPGTFVRVGQHLVGLVQLLEASLCFLIVGMQVGMAFLRLFAIGTLDFVIRRVLLYAQHFIVIALVRHVCSPQSERIGILPFEITRAVYPNIPGGAMLASRL